MGESAAEGLRGSLKTILLVEDDDVVRDLAGTVLREQGYDVLEARTATKAQEIFALEGSRIDLLLTDMLLPGGNGRDLASTFRRARPGIKVLFTSGYGSQLLPQDLASDPGSTFLPKPFRLRDLVATVRTMLA